MKHRGMTLVELLIVMAIIGLVLGVSVPGLVHYSQTARIKSATRQVVGLISLARSQAINSRTEHAVVVDVDDGDVTIVNMDSGEVHESHITLPSSISIAVQVGGEPAEAAELVFRATGSLNGRTTSVILSSEDTQHTITVMAATGAVSVD